jgi:hypothetical protein
MPNHVGVSVFYSFILTSFFTSLTLSRMRTVEDRLLKKIRELENQHSDKCSDNNACHLRN